MLGIVLFRFDGTRYGMALGYNAEGEARSGALHLAEDEVPFPTPTELKYVARHVRQQILRQLAEMELPVSLPEPAAAVRR